MTASTQLARSAADEWAGLVSTAVVGTDRRLPPEPQGGWQAWGSSTDPAVALLDRAAAVVVARARAGARPDASDVTLPSAPVDARAMCPVESAIRLDRILAGQHEVLLPEWMQRCRQLGTQLPWSALPALLLRGRRNPQVDQVVRRLAGGRAAWLAEVLPELGVRVRVAATPAPAAADGWGPPPMPADSGAVVSAVVQVFVDGLATWAAAPQLRLTAAAVDPVWLPALVAQLSQLPYHSSTERARADVLGLAEFRLAMVREFERAHALLPPTTTGDPS